MGTRSKGSKPFAMARYRKKQATTIIMIFPTLIVANADCWARLLRVLAIYDMF